MRIFILCAILSTITGCVEVPPPSSEPCATDTDCRNGFHCNLFFNLCEADEYDAHMPMDDGGTPHNLVDSDSALPDSGNDVPDSGIPEVDSGTDSGMMPDAGPVCSPINLTDPTLECFSTYEYSYIVGLHDINFTTGVGEGAVVFPIDMAALPDEYVVHFHIRRTIDSPQNQNIYILLVENGMRIANTIPFRTTSGLSSDWVEVWYHVSHIFGRIRVEINHGSHVETRDFTMSSSSVPCSPRAFNGLYLGGGYADQRSHYQMRDISVNYECL